MGAVVGAVAGGGGGWPQVGWWMQAHLWLPPPAPAWLRRRPVAGLSHDLASGIIGDLAASLVAGISLAVYVFSSSIFRVMRLHEPLGPPYTKKVIFQ